MPPRSRHQPGQMGHLDAHAAGDRDRDRDGRRADRGRLIGRHQHRSCRGVRKLGAERQATQLTGAPETVHAGVEDLVPRTGVDELMVVTTSTRRGEDRLRSYEPPARAVGMASTSAAA